MINKEFLKEILLRHSVQICLGAILYFYYVGYAALLFSSRSVYGNLLFDIDIVNIICIGLFAFLMLVALISFVLCIYEALKFLFEKFLKNCFKSKRFFVPFFASLLFIIILYLVYVDLIILIDKFFKVGFTKLFLTVFCTLFIIIVICSLPSWNRGFIKNKIVLSYSVFFFALLLIFYPMAVYGVLMQFNVGVEEKEFEEFPASIVTTSIPLNLSSETKIALGYINKIKLIKHKQNESIFLDPSTRQIIILKNNDIIDIRLQLQIDRIYERLQRKKAHY